MLEETPSTDPIKSVPKRPEDVAAMCEGKIAFASPQIAHQAAKRRRGYALEAYHCPASGQFHLGGPLPKRPKPERRQLKRPRNRNGVRNAANWGRE